MRQIGLRLDRDGALTHGGEPVTHPRLREALLRWLDVLPDGRDIVRLDDRRYAYIDVDGPHLRARAARWDLDRCLVTWDDGTEEELAYASVRVDPDGAWQVPVRAGRLRGRIAGAAYQTVTERIDDVDGEMVLRAVGTLWPIPIAAP